MKRLPILWKIPPVITKIPPREEVRDVKLKIDSYLSDLKVKNIECLMFHSFESYMKNKNIFNDLIKLKKEKIIFNIGVSVYTNDEIKLLIEDSVIDVIQIPFNLFDNYNERGKLIEIAKKKKISIHSRSVFLQGLFFKSTSDKNKIVKMLKNHLLKINQIANDEKITIGDLALNYVLQQQSIDNVLIGVDSITQLISNVESLNFELNESTINNINKISINNKNLINPTKWNQI